MTLTGRWAARSRLVFVVSTALITLSLGTLAVVPPSPAGAQSIPSGTWVVTPIPTLSGSANGLNGVSCVSQSFCVAVGTVPENSGQANFEEWTGTAWLPMLPPVPQPGSTLRGVDCLSSAFCMAVGLAVYNLGTPSAGADVWDGTTWGTLPAPSVGGTNTNLLSVSCVTPTFCAAVGGWGPGANQSSVMELWNGTSWTISSPTQGLVNNLVSQLNGVSCTSTTFCVAVGDNGTTVWNGSSWQVGPALSGVYTSVSCVSPSSCTAVGNLFGQTHSVATYNGSSWTAGSLPSDGSTPYGLTSVTCQGSTCYAVGASVAGGTTASEQPVALTGMNGSWTFQQPPMLPSQPGGQLNAIACGPGVCATVGQTYDQSGTGDYQPLAMVSNYPLGYWLVASDGGIFTYGNANFYGSTGALHLNAPIVGMAATPNGKGYWLVASDGGVFSYGNAGFYGSAGNIHLNKPIVGMAATADGGGYFLVASDGGVFTYGDAGFAGSTGGMRLNAPIVGMATDHGGYYLVASDGGIFTFTGAGFYGSAGALHLNQPIVGMAVAPGNVPHSQALDGYWLVAADGGIFTYGDAAFYGSAGAIHLHEPVVGMAATADLGGYWLVASDGGIFTYGDATFSGSAGSIALNQPIVGMALP